MSDGCDLFIEGPEDSLYIGIDENDLNDSSEYALRDYVQTSECEVSHVIQKDEISCPSPHSVSKNDFLDSSDFKDSMSMAQSTFIDGTFNLSESVSSTSLCMADVTVLSPKSFAKDSQDSGAFFHEDSISYSNLSAIRSRLILLQEVLESETKDYKKSIHDLESKNSLLQESFDKSQKDVINLKETISQLQQENLDLKNNQVTFNENENFKEIISRLQKENEDLNNDKAVLNEKLIENENLNEIISRLQKENENLNNDKAVLNEKLIENENLNEIISRLQKENEGLNNGKAVLNEKLKENENFKEIISRLQKENEDLNNDKAVLNKKLIENENFKEIISRLQKENEDLNNDKAVLNEKLIENENFNEIISRLQKENEDLNNDKALLNEKLVENENFNEIISRLQKENEDLNNDKAVLNKKLVENENFNEIISRLQQENEDLKKDKIENEDLKINIEKFQNTIKEILLENENLKLKLEAIQLSSNNQLEETKEKMEQINSEKEILKRELERNDDEIKKISLQNQILEERLIEIQDEKKQICFENESLNQQIEMAQKEMEVFEKKIENKNDYIEHFQDGFKKLFSIDKELHECKIEWNEIGIDTAFKLLSQRLVSAFNAKKICRDEQNKANSLKVENEILNRQIFQFQKEIDDLTEKIEFYQESVRTMTESNSLLIQTNTDLMEQNEIFKKEIQQCSNIKPFDEREFEDLKEKVQELKLDIVDKDSKISSLELHIKSCCSYYRKKAQDYKIEMSDLKQQLKCLRRESGVRMSDPFFPSKPPSPLKKSSSEIAIQTDKSNSPSRMLSLGIVEKHKLKELEELIVQLEKENTILKRLCIKRNETIKMLKSGE